MENRDKTFNIYEVLGLSKLEALDTKSYILKTIRQHTSIEAVLEDIRASKIAEEGGFSQVFLMGICLGELIEQNEQRHRHMDRVQALLDLKLGLV